MAGEKRRVGNRGRWLRGLERETTRVQRSRSSSSGGGNSQPASQPASHLATNLTRPISVEAVVTVVPSVLSPPTSRYFPPLLADSLRSSRGLFLAATRSSGFSSSSVGLQAAPASQPFNSNQFTLAREPQPLVRAYPRECDQTSRPYPLEPPRSLLVPCYHAVATATRTTLPSLITERRYSTIRNSLRRGNRLNN